MPSFAKLRRRWALAAAAFALGGCSIHPIPDDVSHYSTADIARNVRCEAQDAVRQRIRQALHARGIFDVVPDRVLSEPQNSRIRRRDPQLAAKFKAYGVSAITYDFDFDITETNNNNNAHVNFEMPFTSGGKFTLLLDGEFNKTRKAVRKFSSVETFAELERLPCDGWVQPGRNGLYPLTGAIGVRRIINTFINISEMGSMELDLVDAPAGEKAFKDVIKFTTEFNASVVPTLKLKPIPDRFRVKEATLTHDSTRADMHQVTITILFPDLDDFRVAASRRALRGLEMENVVRALENSCVATERAREERFGMLRRIPPALYCRRDFDDPRVIGDPLADGIR